VQSVQGRSGSVVLTLTDLTAAAQTHTHSTANIVEFTAAVASISPIQSVQGRTGNVVLTLADLTAAALTHGHSTTDISGFTAAVSAISPVQSVQGRSGNVVLTLTDLTAAAVSHTHSTSDIVGISTLAGTPGPANKLSIGFVVTGAAGSTATASITGTSPNQELNLTIPRGDPGASVQVAGSVSSAISLPAAGSVSQNTAYVANDTGNLHISNGVNQWTDVGQFRGQNGASGREVELRSGDGYIQWRYAGTTAWTNIVSLASITGAAGPPGASGGISIGALIALS
jgi:hypothetical protein